MVADPIQIIFSIITVTIIAIFSLKVKMIDKAGSIAAEFVGCSILIFGGVEWFIVLLAFFIATGLFTKYKYEQKIKLNAAEERGGARTWKNVLANGVIASISAIGFRISSEKLFIASFIGAIGTSTADTLATEIGLLSHKKPRLITNLNLTVEPGISGGISFLGEAASILGLLLIGLVTWIIKFEKISLLKGLIIILISGFLGSTLDSLLGASVQAVFRCSKCGEDTEKKLHCNQLTNHIKGYRILDNDIVNLISTIFGASVAIFVSIL